MTAPTFRRPNDTATDSGSVKFGAPDVVYAFDVMDGSHATDRLQIVNIQGVDRLFSVDWVVRKKPTDSTVIEIVNTKSGLVQFTGPALYPLLQLLNDSADFKDGHQVLIRPSGPNQTDAYVAVQGGLSLPLSVLFTKDFTIWGYGAKLRGGTTAHQSGGVMKQNAHQKSLRIFGLTMDASEDGTGATKRLGVLVSGGDFDVNLTPKLIHLRDCRLLNVYNRGVHVETESGNPGAGDCTVLIENCVFDAGTTSSIQTFIGVNSSRFLTVNNCAFYGNNHVYSAAQNISFTNCFFTQNGLNIAQDHGGLSLQGRNIRIENVTLLHKDGFSLRSYGTIHAGFLVDRSRRILVKGCTIAPWDITQTTTNLTISAYDDANYAIDECIISDCYFLKGKMLNTTTASPDNLHGKIKHLVLDNCYMAEFDGAACIATIEDTDIDYFKITNIKTPSPYPTNGAPVRIQSVSRNAIVSYLKIKDNSYPQTSPEGYIVFLSGTTNTQSVVFDSPLGAGQNIQRPPTGAGTKSFKFLTNWGRATLSGNGSNLVFNIPHNLVASPNTKTIRVTAGSADARGPKHVSGDATNVIVTFASGNAPASGTNNVVLYWYASAA